MAPQPRLDEERPRPQRPVQRRPLRAPKTASGGLRRSAQLRARRSGPQSLAAPGENRPRYDRMRRRALLPQSTQLPGITVVANKMSDDERDREAEKDYEVCRSLSSAAARARCWASAADRDGARAAGRPLPPLVTQRNGPTISPGQAGQAAGALSGAALLYWIISEGSRLFPPRNLVPIP